MRRVTLAALLSSLALLPLWSCTKGDGGPPPAPPAAPTVESVDATAVGESGATLNGVVNPSGLATRAWFEYGTAPAPGERSASEDVGDGVDAVSVSSTVTGLVPGTVYSFRACAESSAGRTDGRVLSFRTASQGSAPAVVTMAATSIGASGATLNGSVIPNGLESTAWFEWGADAALAGTTVARAVGAGLVSQPLAEALTGLTAGTPYCYRIAAANSTGPARGAIACFTTTSSSVFGVVSTSPVDGATGVPLGSVVTVTFSQDVEPASLVGAIAVTSSAGEISGVVSYNATTRTATFTPAAPLAPLTGYTVTVEAKVKSVYTVRLAAPYVIRFTSGSPLQTGRALRE